MVQVMELGLLILFKGICGLPSFDQEAEGTFVLTHEHAVRLSFWRRNYFFNFSTPCI